MPAGSELLIVDTVPRDREGMREYFDGLGYVCTAVDSAQEARNLVVQKFFPAALVDLDVGQPGAGVDLVRYIRQRSRPTSVVLLTGRRSFEGAVEAYRAGAMDVVRKSPEHVDHLKQQVALACERYQAAEEGDELYREIRSVLDESFKVMLGLSRKVYAHLSLAAAPLRPQILIVDQEQEFLRELSELVQDKPWDITGEMTGGAALDKGMSQKVDIVAARDELMDLRGSMVIRSIQANRGEALGLLYSGADGGHIDRMEQGQVEETYRPFGGAQDLVDRIEALFQELGTKSQERRFIQAFRADHQDFVRRYAELKLRIDRLIND